MAIGTAHLKKEFIALRLEIQRHMADEAAPLEPGGRAERQALSEGSLLSFMELYLPHWLALPPSGLHRSLDLEFASMRCDKNKMGQKFAIAAPRGNGKTTLLRALALDLLLRNKKSFILWISGSLDQAKDSLESIKNELAGNLRLAQDFSGSTGQGPLWNQEEVVLMNGSKIKIAGVKKRIRGLNHDGQRPDLVIIDDLETDEEVLNPELRDKAFNWLFSSLIPLGPPDGRMDLLFVGTIMHPDAALARALKQPGFTGLKYQSLQSWPKRLDLWELFENKLLQEGPTEANLFYEAHQTEMQEGAECLWPEAQSLPFLMQKKAESKKSFFAEYQNQPISEGDQIFTGFHYYEALPEALTYYGAIDPALGGANGDYSALLILGRSAKGLLFVVEAQLIKVKPHELMERIFSLHERHNCHKWVVEEVQFQAFFKAELARLSTERAIYLPLTGTRPKGPKRLRIEALEPLVKTGTILFRKEQRLLLEQMENFPHARHDDGPDALEMAFQLAKSSGATGSGVKSQRPGSEGSSRRFLGY